ELIHAYDLPAAPALVTSTKLLDNIKQDSENDMKKESAHLAALLKNTDCVFTSAIERGSILDMLNSKDYRDADFIVIGSQGKGAKTEYAIGSTALNVMQNANIPVLVIPKTLVFNEINKIVYGADLEGLSSNSILDPVLELLDNNQAILEIAHISDEPNSDKKKRMDDLVRLFGEGRARSKYLNQGNVTVGFEELIDETKPDLLVMVNRQKSFFTSIFYPSITIKMVLRSYFAILMLNDKNRIQIVMKDLLLPPDLSENARHSIEYAAHLFANEAVEFIIINTYDLPPTPAQL